MTKPHKKTKTTQKKLLKNVMTDPRQNLVN
jgi:hypothetical protein